MSPAPHPDFEEEPPPLRGADLLDAIHRFLGRFVAYPSEHARIAHTLWVAHTHFMEHWTSTPRIAFLSPEPGSGKTRALEVSELLVPRPVEAINATPAYLFRKVSDEAGPPTILFDEIDTIFGPRAKENEEIRGVLNAGHRKGAVAGRCVVKGKTVTTEELPAYCAVAVAGLGDLPDTLLSRSVVVRMKRRSPGEVIEPFRRRTAEVDGRRLCEDLEAWAHEAAGRLSWPALPDGVTDRDADVWEALVAVADLAGGEWAERSRVTAVTHVTDSKAATPSLGIRLLSDLRDVFGTDTEAMFTTDILTHLLAVEEAPWADLKGKPLNARGLSQRLGRYGVKRGLIRVGEKVGRGYRREDLDDVWSRYLPPPSPFQVRESAAVTRLQNGGGDGEGGGDVGVATYGSVTSVTSVTDEDELALGVATYGSVTSVTSVTDEGESTRGGEEESAMGVATYGSVTSVTSVTNGHQPVPVEDEAEGLI